MRVASQAGQAITLRNNANGANIGYGWAANELAGASLLVLSGASRGLARPITANNTDNGTGGTITYGGATLTLAQGDWRHRAARHQFPLPGHDLQRCHRQPGALLPGRRFTTYESPRQFAAGPINGYTLTDLGWWRPPRRPAGGLCHAASGYDVKLAVSYDGSTPALVVHCAPPATDFQGVRGAFPFACRVLDGGRVYLNNENTANQAVKITGWRE